MVHTSRPPHVVPDSIIGGRYQVLAELGRGGMSIVYRARDRVLDQDIALKLLRSPDEEPRNLLFLQQEFRAMARLRHPRLVQVFDYGVTDNGAAYFTMELLPGTDLSTLRDLPLASVFQIVLSIADALGFMHTRGYVHRDVKPSNVRVVSEPDQPIEVKLMDCGLTERIDREDAAVAGTFAYLAPEAWLGGRTGARGDLYALGVLAYEITAGCLPFDTKTSVRLLISKTERPRDLREVRPDVPIEFARLVRDLLMPEPASRPASAMEVASRLAELADIDFQPDSTVYLHTPALVGRSRELTQLRDDIKQACEGTPSPTVILGPAGAGKTRLLDEILLEMGLRGAVIARATGRGFSGGPYEVLRELLAPLMHLPNADTVLSRIGGSRTLLLANGAPGRAEHVGDTSSAQKTIHQSFAAFLDGISKHRRVVLAVDDIHLADAASIDALAGLASAGTYGNIAILATERVGEPISQSLSHWHSSARRLELDRLTQGQIGELIVAALGPASPSPSLVAELEQASAGNVYFVLEILRSLAGLGLIERKRTRICLPESLADLQLPASLSQALERRLSSLSPAGLALARVAAVVGRAMDLELGRALVDVTDDEYFDALDELRREQLVQLENRSLTISHPRLCEVLKQGLTPQARRELHRRVADQILARAQGSDCDCSAELGEHYAEAGDESRALDYLVQAGDERYRGFAYFDAREAYRRAFELLEGAPAAKRAELERKLNDRLGRICFYHDHRHGPAFLERARRFHLDHGALWLIVPLSRLLGGALAVLIAVGISAVMNAARLRRNPLRQALGHLLDAFASTTYLANCYTYSGRPQLALQAAEHLTPFIYSRHRLPQVGYLMARVYALFLMNRFDEAAASTDSALWVLKRDQVTPASEHDRIHATGGALITRLWIDLARGYVKRSKWWQPFEEYVQSHPTALLESWLMEVRVYAAYRQGNMAESELAWKRFSEKAVQAEVMFVQVKTKAWVGMAYLEAGRTSDAQDMADEVIRSARDPENPFILALGLYLRGMALQAWEQLDDAEQCMQEAADLACRADVACWELYHSILLSRASLMLERGEHARARQLAQRVDQHNGNQRLVHGLHDSRTHRVLGRAALADGCVTEAVRYLEHSLARASALDDVLECARSFHFLAQALSAEGNETYARECRQECERLLLRLGNRYQLRKLGYHAENNRESGNEASALSRAMQYAFDSDAKSTMPSYLDAPRACPGEPPRDPCLQQDDLQLSGHTLVAGQTRPPPEEQH